MSPAASPSEPRVRVGSYELLRLLGEGSMGRVYEARHVKLDRIVAIKMLRPEQATRADLVQRIFQEARTVNRINHPHIVEIHDFVEDVDDEGRPRAYCVMEYLPGETLASLLRREPLSLERIALITDQVCRALAAAHQVGVVHRDVKPENILVTQGADGRDFAKVLDFGVAKLLQPDPKVGLRSTSEGAMVGTPRYMSPEQAASLDVDYRADIYGVGCLLYEMLTGRPPFDADAFGPLVARILTQPPAPIGEHTDAGEAVPAELAVLTLQCLEKDPSLRPRSVEDIRRQLPVATQTAPRKGASRRRRGGAVFASLGLVALAFTVLALRPSVEAAEEPATLTASVVPRPQESTPAAHPPATEWSAEAQVAATLDAVPAATSVDAVPAGTVSSDPTRPSATARKASHQRRAGGRSDATASNGNSRDAVLNPFAQ